jgi:prepilin-type processing-associated H-X9-DG protein
MAFEPLPFWPTRLCVCEEIPMRPLRRPGFAAPDLLVILAVIGILAGLLVMSVVKARLAAGRIQSINNLKQIAIAAHNYHDSENAFPAGIDKKNYSAFARLLPYIEQVQVYRLIDFSKPVDDRANDKARQVHLKLFLSPLDPQKTVYADRGASNYLFCAGSKPGLRDNNGVFCLDSKVPLGQITNANGSSNTIMAAETLKGDGGTKASDVRRQHVLLKPEPPKVAPAPKVDAEQVKQWIADLGSDQFEVRKKATDELQKLGEAIEPILKKAREAKLPLETSKRLDQMLQKIDSERQERLTRLGVNLKEDAGTAEWKASTDIVGDPGGSWLDGRFLQTTFTATRPFNDSRPDVSVQGRGGLSAMRTMGSNVVPVAFCDGHVQSIPTAFELKSWKCAANWMNTDPFVLP